MHQYPNLAKLSKAIYQLKTVVYIAGKKIQQPKNLLFVFPLIANISFYALSWPKLNFGYQFHL